MGKFYFSTSGGYWTFTETLSATPYILRDAEYMCRCCLVLLNAGIGMRQAGNYIRVIPDAVNALRESFLIMDEFVRGMGTREHKNGMACEYPPFADVSLRMDTLVGKIGDIIERAQPNTKGGA